MSMAKKISRAFVITRNGRLLDAGIVHKSRGEYHLYRLHPKALERSKRQQVPEQLGLLFCLAARREQDDSERLSIHEYLLAPNDIDDAPLKSKNYPGLVTYIRNFRNRKYNKSRIPVAHPSKDGGGAMGVGRDEIFDRRAIDLIFRRSKSGSNQHGIVLTGRLRSSDIWLLEAPSEDVTQIYAALRGGEGSYLRKIRINGKDIEILEHSFQAAVGLKDDTLVSNVDEILKNIDNELDNALQFDVEIVSDTWPNRIAKIRNKVKSELAKYVVKPKYINEEYSSRNFLIAALHRYSEHNSEAHLLTALVHLRYQAFNDALRVATEYIKAVPKDSFGLLVHGYSACLVGEYDIARGSYSDASELGESVAAGVGIAITYIQQRNFSKAYKWIRKVEDESPFSLQVCRLKATWLQSNGDSKNAIKQLKLAPSFEKWGFAVEMLACCEFVPGQYLKVLRLARHASNLRSWPAWEADCLIAGILLATGHFSWCRKYAENVLDQVQIKSYRMQLRRILWYAAYYTDGKVEVIQQSEAMCNEEPGNVCHKIRLAADLCWFGDDKLAASVFPNNIDVSRFTRNEAAEMARLCMFAQNMEHARELACLIRTQEQARHLIHQLSAEQILRVLLNLYMVAYIRANGYAPGMWQEALQAIRLILQVCPDNPGLTFLDYACLAHVAEAVQKTPVCSIVCCEWSMLSCHSYPPLVRCKAGWRGYVSWLKGGQDKQYGAVVAQSTSGAWMNY